MEAIRTPSWARSGDEGASGTCDTEQRFLTHEEVAAYCGVPVCEVRSWISAGRLQATRLEDGRYRVRGQDFLMLLYRMMAARERLRD